MIDVGRPCAWCDTTLVRRRGGWKQPGLHGRISETQARAIHLVYMRGVSAHKLGQRLYEQLGYASPGTCEMAIGVAFRRLGLHVRERIEATVLASTRNGLSPRNDRERRARRTAAGLNTQTAQPLRPRCAAVRVQYPRKGQPCRRPATGGSDYCTSHDPARQDERAAHLAAARDRLHAEPQTSGVPLKEAGARSNEC